MTGIESAVQIGGGMMGKLWLRELSYRTDTTAVVDPNSDASDSIEDTNSHFINANILSSWVQSHSEVHLREFVKSADMWSIAVGPSKHPELLERAIDADVNMVVLEEPIGFDLDYVRNLNNQADDDMYIAVDYIECVNPGVVAAIQDAVNQGFVPTSGIHKRKKSHYPKSEEYDEFGGLPVTKEGLIHDVAEIDWLFRNLAVDPPEMAVKNIQQFTKWENLVNDTVFPYEGFNSDVRATFTLEVDGVEFKLQGDYYTDDEERCFFWIGQDREVGYFVNTLNREHITPVAYRIEEEESVNRVERELERRTVTSDNVISSMLKRTVSTRLTPATAVQRDPMTRMADKVFNKNAPCELKDALRIESVLEEVYRQKDSFESMKY